MSRNRPPNDSDLERLPDNFKVMFAIFCAEQVFKLVHEDDRDVALKAIDAARGFLQGGVTREQALKAFEDAADVAFDRKEKGYIVEQEALDAAAYAGLEDPEEYPSEEAAEAADYAVHAAQDSNKIDKKELIKQQWDYYDELVNFDKNFEEIVLRGH